MTVSRMEPFLINLRWIFYALGILITISFPFFFFLSSLTFPTVFSPIPTRPEPYSLNLTQEYSRFSVQSDPKSSVPGSGPAGPGKTSPSPTVQQQSSSGSTGDGRFNCGPCKKSFGSEATFHSHQMSAKHIAAVKDADKKNKGKGSSKSGSTNNNNNNNNNARAKQRAEEEEPDHPEVTEALMSLRKVEKIVKENPNMAASVLWKIAKGKQIALPDRTHVLLEWCVLICSGLISYSPVVTSPSPRNSQSLGALDQYTLGLAIYHHLCNTGTTRIFDTDADQHDTIPFAPFDGQARFIPFAILCCAVLFGRHSRPLANSFRRDPAHL